MRITISDMDAGTRLDKLLVERVPSLGRAGAKRLFSEGRVRVVSAGKRRRAAKGDVAAAGETVEIDVEPEELGSATVPDPEVPLDVVLERPDLVVVNKPAGIPTAPLAAGERGTL